MASSSKRSSVQWRQLELGAGFNTIVTVLIILVGTFGALYSDESRSVFPFYFARETIAWHALLFGDTTIITALLLFGRQGAVDTRCP